jgi:hypothetical protein
MRNLSCIAIAFVFHIHAFGQASSLHTYDFLNLPSAARVAALGGTNIAVKDNDVNLALDNPSLLNPSMHNHLALNVVNYISDVKFGYVGYAYNLSKYGTFNTGIQYSNYGEFQGANVNSDPTGTFSAAEYNLNFGWGKQLNSLASLGFSPKFDSLFSIGANFKTVYSHLDQYSSVALAVDLGTTYYNKKRELATAFVIRNFGSQIKAYRPGYNEALPFEMQVSVSKKLSKAPLRFSITYRHLEQYDITYFDSSKVTVDPITSVVVNPTSSYFEKTMRHLVFGTEFLLTKNFNIRAGFNYQRRAELEVASRNSVIGFSGGFGLKISKFQLSYAIASYHLAGTSNHFSITTNLSDFWVKKN